ncbi:uncharacterized protein LOC141585154 isoform X2 [Saimiri boliviensis]|uniref:uncharacterized protein LOC141585154 isoform X2 n=1 Tax=Saimiri boliviensis TaxID=27679 RepID=UPI003D77DB75
MPARWLLQPPIPGRGLVPRTALRPLPPARLARRWRGVSGAQLPGRGGEGHPGVPSCAHPHAPIPIVLPRVGLGRGTSGGPLPEGPGSLAGAEPGTPTPTFQGEKCRSFSASSRLFSTRDNSSGAGRDAVHPPQARFQSPASCAPARSFSHPPGAASRRPSLRRRNPRGQGAPSPKPGEGTTASYSPCPDEVSLCHPGWNAMVHCNLHLPSSSDSPASASRVAGITGPHHYIQRLQ